MTFRNDSTGDVLEVPPPDVIGQSVVLFNGQVVEQVFYSDDGGGSATTGDGRRFSIAEWSRHLLDQVNSGAWKSATTEGPQ